MYHAICILEEGLRGYNVSMCREGSGRFEVNQWHQGFSDGRIDEMDMAGLVLGASLSLKGGGVTSSLSSMMAGPGAVGFGVLLVVGTEAV